MNINPYKPFRFSRTGFDKVTPSATLAINDRVRKLWSAGRQVYHLGFGESRFPVPTLIADALKQNVQQRSYLPTLGLPELREKIATFYSKNFHMEVEPHQVVTGIGSKSLLFSVMQVLDGETILPTPCWVSYVAQAQLSRHTVHFLPLREIDNYRLTVADLETTLERVSRNPGYANILVVTTPNNPTSTTLAQDDAKQIAAFARDQAIMVLSDEIYALLNYTKESHISLAHYYPEGTVVFGGLSKHLSLGGWRFGVAILPPGKSGETLCEALQALAGSVWTCVPGPIQYAALVAYSNLPEIDEYINMCTTMHTIRTRYLYNAFLSLGIPCPEPKGGFYLYPSFNAWRAALYTHRIKSSEDLAAYLLEKYELLVLAGSSFGDDPTNLTLRIATSYLDADTDDKVEALVAHFQKRPDPQDFIKNYHPQLRQVVDRFAAFVDDLNRGK